MKKRIICLSVLIAVITLLIPYSKGDNFNTYFVYLKHSDRLINKLYYKNTISIIYQCACYANKNHMEFRCSDTTKKNLTSALPTKYYSMTEFAQLANKEWSIFEEKHFLQDKIYFIEEISNHKYKYYQVKFYPREHEE